jgi:spermidine synthase
MSYRLMRDSRPPPFFQLRLNLALSRLSLSGTIALPPARLLLRMRDYVESMLLAENLPPTAENIAAALRRFVELVELSAIGKPFIYRKRHSVALMFDICAVQSEMHLDSPDELMLGYTHSMMGFLIFNPAPASIAMIGLGGGSLPKYCHRHLPQASIVVVENDAAVIALRDVFCIPEDDARFEVRHADGAEFVRRSSGRFDVLMVDGFDRTGQPAQLCSQRFYDDCRNALAQDGILVVNLLGDNQDMAIFIDRMRVSFDGAVIVTDALDSSNKIVFACNGNLLNLPEKTITCNLKSLESRHALALRGTARSILRERKADAFPLLRA